MRSLFRRRGAALMAACALAFVASTARAVDPAIKCEAGKLKEAGQYVNCRLKAEAKGVQKGEAPDYTKCEEKFSDKWSKAEAKAGPGICPSEGDEASMTTFITTHTDAIALALMPAGSLPNCGDGSVNATGEHCDAADLDGYSCAALGYFGGALACDGSCDFDVAGCGDTCEDSGGVTVGGFCWFLGGTNTSCNSLCGSVGLVYDDATKTFAGSDGTNQNCHDVMVALGKPPQGVLTVGADGRGCYSVIGNNNIIRDFNPTDPDNAVFGDENACACK